MRRLDPLIKRVMYASRTSVKNKHADAFVRYNSWAKLRNLLRVETAIRTGRVCNFGYPYLLTMEPTNRCNLRCPLCPTGRGLQGRPPQTLDMAAFERILEEVGPYVYMINFQNWGEPTLARQLPEMIAKAHAARIATTVATNGNYSPKLNARLIEAGLDNLIVAIDGATQESHQKYRVQGKLALVKENVRQLVDARDQIGKRRPYVEVQFLVFEYNRHEIPAIWRLAGECRADGLLIRAAVAPGNTANRRRFYTWNEERNFCRRFWYTASINADLGVTPCCNFFFRQDDLGNVGSGSFDSVWNGDTYVRNRVAVVNRDFEQLHANCNACKKYNGKLGCEAYGVEGAEVDAAWNAPSSTVGEACDELLPIQMPR